MENTIILLLDMTAFRMDAPKLFGASHICAALFTVAAAVCVAAGITKRIKAAEPPGNNPTGTVAGIPGHKQRRKLIRILAGTGWVLVVLEVYKQLFLYYVVNGGAYDWWYFPFQLCSVPMYLCILLPLVPQVVQKTFLTFMGGYTFISAAAALIYPADMLRSYATLTLHGFIWHGLLLFISLLIFFCGASDSSPRGLLGAALLFGILCVIAITINVAAGPSASMFYLNPYRISLQPLVGDVQKVLGIPAGLILYALVIVAAGSLANVLLRRLSCDR